MFRGEGTLLKTDPGEAGLLGNSRPLDSRHASSSNQQIEAKGANLLGWVCSPSHLTRTPCHHYGEVRLEAVGGETYGWGHRGAPSWRAGTQGPATPHRPV